MKGRGRPAPRRIRPLPPRKTKTARSTLNAHPTSHPSSLSSSIISLISSIRSLEERGWVPDDLDTGAPTSRRGGRSAPPAADASFRKAMKGMRVVAMEELSDAQIEAARARRLRERCGEGGAVGGWRGDGGGEKGMPRVGRTREREREGESAGRKRGDSRLWREAPPLAWRRASFFPDTPRFSLSPVPFYRAARPPPPTGRPSPWTSRTTTPSPRGRLSPRRRRRPRPPT